MELWLDTAEINLIKQFYKTGLLFGVTTNPSILASTGRIAEEVLREILDSQPGPVAAQVTADNAPDMLRQARKLRTFSSRIIVKIPAIPAGFQAMQQMNEEQIPIMSTTILNAAQVLLSGIAKASYAAPYLGRMDLDNLDYVAELKTILSILQQQQLPTKIIGAAIKDVKQILTCAELGIPAITLPPAVFEQLIHPPLSSKNSLIQFATAWENCPAKSKLFAIEE